MDGLARPMLWLTPPASDGLCRAGSRPNKEAHCGGNTMTAPIDSTPNCVPLYGSRRSGSSRNTSVAVMVLTKSQAPVGRNGRPCLLGRPRAPSRPRLLPNPDGVSPPLPGANSPLGSGGPNHAGFEPCRRHTHAELSGWSADRTVRLPVVGRAPFTWIAAQPAPPDQCPIQQADGIVRGLTAISTSEIVVACQIQQYHPHQLVETRLTAAYGYIAGCR